MLQRFSADMQLVHQNLGGSTAVALHRGSAREGKRNANAINNLANGLVVVQKRKSHVAVSKYAANNLFHMELKIILILTYTMNEIGILSEENSPRD